MAANPADAPAVAELSANPLYNATLRSTCVVTEVSGGHAPNALPQAATANVNCRICPGTPGAEVQQTLRTVPADPRISVEPVDAFRAPAPAPPLSDAILGPATQVATGLWGNVPLLPTMSLGVKRYAQ